MVFYNVSSIEAVVPVIVTALTHRLTAGQKVLWLVTGGSAITIEAAVSRQLQGAPLENLTVILMDERFGPVGHPDSNWQQLLEAGFSLQGAQLVPIVQGKNRQDSTLEFAKNLQIAFETADYSLGLFGIGPDGHTAGILPGSPDIATDRLATSYADSEANPPEVAGVYRDKDRITMTGAAMRRLDEIIVVALGKDPALFDKLEQDISPSLMPAQLLKQVKNFSIYNDHKGGEV